jgi:DNA-binding LacI/PurR family transcriptional regulator
VAFVSGPEDASPTRERAEGFITTLREAGRRVARIPGRDFSYESGRAAAAPLLRERPACDAVFCAGDVVAIGLMDAARASGLVLPGDLAVAGFDDVPTAGYDAYALTTMRQDAEGLAEATVFSLRELLAGRTPADRVVPARLITRRSTLG